MVPAEVGRPERAGAGEGECGREAHVLAVRRAGAQRRADPRRPVPSHQHGAAVVDPRDAPAALRERDDPARDPGECRRRARARRCLAGDGRHKSRSSQEQRCMTEARHGRSVRPSRACRPAAARSASALSVRSHVKSGSSRPKWPYAAVLRRSGGAGRGRARSPPGAGRSARATSSSIRAHRDHRSVPNVSTSDRDRLRDADRVGDLHLAAVGEAGGDDVLGHVARGVGGRAVDLRRVLARERAAAVAAPRRRRCRR